MDPSSLCTCYSQETHLTLSEFKTGTASFRLIVSRLFENTKAILKECEPEREDLHPQTLSKFSAGNFSFLEHAGHVLIFSWEHQHGSIWSDALSRESIAELAVGCSEEGIPVGSDECLQKMPSLAQLRDKPKVAIAITIRDPIAASVAYVRHVHGDLSESELNERIYLDDGCKVHIYVHHVDCVRSKLTHLSPSLSLKQAMISSISVRFAIANALREYGFDVGLFYFEDFVSNPPLYAYHIAHFLGLDTEGGIMPEVVQEAADDALAAVRQVRRVVKVECGS